MTSPLYFYYRNFIFKVPHNHKQLVQNEEEFVSSFVRASREHYARVFPKHASTFKFSDASTDHTVEGFVKEVI